jgi:hypothetical protein
MIEIEHPGKMLTTFCDKRSLVEIRKESLDIYNRIHSIAEDALFVEQVAEQYGGYPVIRAASFLSLAILGSNRAHSKSKMRSLVR